MPKKANVWVIDDDPYMHEIFKDALSEEGHNVVLEASSVYQALEQLKSGEIQKKRITVVILDGSMSDDRSDNDGVTVFRAIEDFSEREKAKIVVIACTAIRGEIHYGHQKISKPFNLDALLNLISAA